MICIKWNQDLDKPKYFRYFFTLTRVSPRLHPLWNSQTISILHNHSNKNAITKDKKDLVITA